MNKKLMFFPEKNHFSSKLMKKTMFERSDPECEVGPDEFCGHSVVPGFPVSGSCSSKKESRINRKDLVNATRIFSSILLQHNDLSARSVALYDLITEPSNSHLSADNIVYVSSFFNDLTNLLSCCIPGFSMDDSTMQNLTTLTQRASVEVYQIVDLFFQFARIMDENGDIIQEYIQNLNEEHHLHEEEEEQLQELTFES